MVKYASITPVQQPRSVKGFFNYTFSLWKDWRAEKIQGQTYEGRRRRREWSDCSSVVTDQLSTTGNNMNVANAMSSDKNWCGSVSNPNFV